MHSFGSLYPTPSLFFFLLTYLFALFPRSERLEQARILKKRLPSTGWFNFWKESEIARAKSGEYSGCSINRMPLSWRYVCVLRAVGSCIVVMQLDSRPTSSPCRWLVKQKNFWQHWSCVICGSDCSFVGHYVDNNRPLSIEENGEHSLSWTETCFQDLREWVIFGQPNHIRTFIFHNEGGNSTLVSRNNITTSENFLEPFGSNSWNHLRQIHYIVTICSFCSVFNWRGTHLANLLDRLSCSWTIACKYRVFQKFVPIFYSLKFH